MQSSLSFWNDVVCFQVRQEAAIKLLVESEKL